MPDAVALRERDITDNLWDPAFSVANLGTTPTLLAHFQCPEDKQAICGSAAPKSHTTTCKTRAENDWVKSDESCLLFYAWAATCSPPYLINTESEAASLRRTDRYSVRAPLLLPGALCM